MDHPKPLMLDLQHDLTSTMNAGVLMRSVTKASTKLQYIFHAAEARKGLEPAGHLASAKKGKGDA